MISHESLQGPERPAILDARVCVLRANPEAPITGVVILKGKYPKYTLHASPIKPGVKAFLFPESRTNEMLATLSVTATGSSPLGDCREAMDALEFVFETGISIPTPRGLSGE